MANILNKKSVILAIFILTNTINLYAQNVIEPNTTTLERDNIAQKKLESQKAYAVYEKLALAYWQEIADKRKIRNQKRRQKQNIQLEDYVLTQPPIYNPPATPLEETAPTIATKPVIPTINDFVEAAKNTYNFIPEFPLSEAEFMYKYVQAAKKLGFNQEQIVAIYAFETGGVGTYDLQSGMIKGLENAVPNSTALGYNQLVATTSVSLMWEFGTDFAKVLKQKAKETTGKQQNKLLDKLNIINKMTKTAKTVPHIWKEQAKLAKTDVGLAMHAMLLDKDVGPLLQIYKLKTTLNFLNYKGFKRQISGAEFEMLNLAGDGNGFDMITLPTSWQDKVPTSNFFVRSGYERNRIVQSNKTVTQLLKATDKKIQEYKSKNGAKMLYNAF